MTKSTSVLLLLLSTEPGFYILKFQYLLKPCISYDLYSEFVNPLWPWWVTLQPHAQELFGFANGRHTHAHMPANFKCLGSLKGWALKTFPCYPSPVGEVATHLNSHIGLLSCSSCVPSFYTWWSLFSLPCIPAWATLRVLPCLPLSIC